MKTRKNKIVAITISIFFILSMTASMILVPSAKSQTLAPGKIDIPTIAFINVAPNPIGVGQSATIDFGLTMPPPTANGPYGDRYTGLTIKVTKPDGTTQTLGPFSSDDTGGTTTAFTPAEIGTYSFEMSYPGQTLNGGQFGSEGVTSAAAVFLGDYMEPATSTVTTLTVQQQPVGSVSSAPLPTSYWQTPINAMNVNTWAAIGGADLEIGTRGGTASEFYNQSGNYNPYTTAPLTSHIIWTKQEAFGGALGGPYPESTTYGNYYSTRQYEREYAPIIMNGYLYYTDYPGSSTTPAANICLDLYSGQVVWTDNAQNYGGGSTEQTALTTAGVVTPLKMGQILDYVSPNQFGGLSYLWTQGTLAGIVNSGTEWNMFDAMTGQYILSIVNGTGVTMTQDQWGNLVGYYVNATAGKQLVMGSISDNTGPAPTINTSTGPTLNEWNSTECIMAGGWSATASGWEWRPTQDGVIPFSDGLTWRVPIATSINGVAFPTNLAIWSVNSGVLILDSEAPGISGFQGGWIVFAGYSDTTGQQLWIENVTATPFTYTNLDTAYLAGDGVFLTITKETGTVDGYSMNTGKLLWNDVLTTINGAPPNAFDAVGGYQGAIANENLYLDALGGDIWSINILTGTINWYTNTTTLQGSAGYNTPYGVWPIWEQEDIGIAGMGSNTVIFLDEGHEYSPPLFLGAQQLAINATNGSLIWSIDGFNVDDWPGMADGVMTVNNAYDNQIYAYAQGPSQTTVTAPDLSATVGQPLVIRGAVMDVSSGASQEEVAKSFPNGLPCVSDASMSQFMEAVYMQQPMPANITGVPVTISVTDSNGNTYVIGTTETTATGMFTLSYSPAIAGNFTVTATFAGTNGYYGSSAQTSFVATSAAATAAPTATPLSGLASNTTLMYGIVAIAIIIIVIGAAILFVVTRKHP